jgi:ATP-binding cassette, subfamily B, bacterial MsbA
MVFQFGWKYLCRYWGRLCAGVLLGVLFGLSNASFAWATKTLVQRFKAPDNLQVRQANLSPAKKVTWVDERIARIERSASAAADRWLPRIGMPMTWQMMLGLLLFLPLLVAVRSGTDYGSSYCMGWVSERVINDLRFDILEKLTSLSLGFFTRATTGDLLTRINSDAHKLQRALKQGAADLLKESMSVATLLTALLWINWQLTLLTFAFIPLCLGPLLILGRKARKAAGASRIAEILQTGHFVEFVNGVRIVKAYNLEGTLMERYRKLTRELVRQGMKGIKAKELVNPLVEVISMLGLGVLVVFIFKTGTTLDDFVGFLTAVMFFFLSVKKLSGVHIIFEQANPSVARLHDILQQQPTVREPERPVALSRFQKELRFENVTFAYEDRVVIQDFTLVIPRGARVGIAGASGSGKSTLVNLLLRFYDPRSGRITIDGVDISHTTFIDLRSLMALVSQDVVLFDTSVADNIAQGKPGATHLEIETAARDAYAHEFIMQLPQGYDTRVGERGITLSTGQRQRISIARAFIRNAPILILDEATASLDSQAEAEVQRAIDHLSENRTVISVAHRLSTLSNCDRVVVLAQGRIIEQGGFHDLLRGDGPFAAMARRQGIDADFPSTINARVLG